MTTTQLSFRQVQVTWGLAIAFAIVCIFFGGFTRKPFAGGLGLLHWVLMGIVVGLSISALSIPRELLKRARSGAERSNTSASAGAWTGAQVIGIGLAAGIFAWGLVSNIIIPSPGWLSDAIYTTGILLLFKSLPRKSANPAVLE